MPPLALKRITKELLNINDKDYIEHSTYSKEFKNFLGSLTIFLTLCLCVVLSSKRCML